MLNSKTKSLKAPKKNVARVKSNQVSCVDNSVFVDFLISIKSDDLSDTRASFRRKSSLPDSSEITRQFVTKRKKIINKGDTKHFSDAKLTEDLLGNILTDHCLKKVLSKEIERRIN